MNEWMNEHGALLESYWPGRTGTKTCPSATLPAQMSHGLERNAGHHGEVQWLPDNCTVNNFATFTSDVRYRVHKRLQQVPNLSQLKSLTFKAHFNIIPIYAYVFRVVTLPSDFLTTIPACILDALVTFLLVALNQPAHCHLWHHCSPSGDLHSLFNADSEASFGPFRAMNKLNALDVLLEA
jgi:hypothetical protein